MSCNEVNNKNGNKSSDNDDCIVLGGGFLLIHGLFSFMVMAVPLVISHSFRRAV
jgi:hypothetical protein